MNFNLIETSIDSLWMAERLPKEDKRGHLMRMYCEKELLPVLNGKKIVQINHSLTKEKGTVRGLHFQLPPHSETKVITCVRGEIFDVALDLRAGSPTFMQWHAEILSVENNKSIIIPEGFAHGFQTLTDDCELIYYHTAFYEAQSEAGVNMLDPKLNITWPINVKKCSQRDAQLPFADVFSEGI